MGGGRHSNAHTAVTVYLPEIEQIIVGYHMPCSKWITEYRVIIDSSHSTTHASSWECSAVSKAVSGGTEERITLYSG